MHHAPPHVALGSAGAFADLDWSDSRLAAAAGAAPTAPFNLFGASLDLSDSFYQFKDEGMGEAPMGLMGYKGDEAMQGDKGDQGKQCKQVLKGTSKPGAKGKGKQGGKGGKGVQIVRGGAAASSTTQGVQTPFNKAGKQAQCKKGKGGKVLRGPATEHNNGICKTFEI